MLQEIPMVSICFENQTVLIVKNVICINDVEAGGNTQVTEKTHISGKTWIDSFSYETTWNNLINLSHTKPLY